MSVSFAAEVHGFNDMRSTATEYISIVIIDRQTLSRSCLIRILRGELPEVAIHDIATADAVVGILEKNISLAVLNIENCNLTDEWVSVNLAYIHQLRPETPIMLLTQLDEASITDAIIGEVARWGVRGYTTNSAPVEVVLAAVRLILAGGAYYPRSMVTDDGKCPHIVSSASDTISALPVPVNGEVNNALAVCDASPIAFTERERQVLATLRRGLPTRSSPASWICLKIRSRCTSRISCENSTPRTGPRPWSFPSSTDLPVQRPTVQRCIQRQDQGQVRPISHHLQCLAWRA
jgi:DNA-binding NarL/FixJ family response regulator